MASEWGRKELLMKAFEELDDKCSEMRMIGDGDKRMICCYLRDFIFHHSVAVKLQGELGAS
jgi:hypothetical protein